MKYKFIIDEETKRIEAFGNVKDVYQFYDWLNKTFGDKLDGYVLKYTLLNQPIERTLVYERHLTPKK